MELEVTAIKDFLKPIVTAYFPDEQTSFEIEGDQLISDVLQNKRIHTSSLTNQPDFGFGVEDLVAVASFVKLIVGTISTLRDLNLLPFHKVNRPEPNVVLRQRWERTLEKAGLPHSKAAEIADKFLTSLFKVSDG
jgi:hypothetical protein